MLETIKKFFGTFIPNKDKVSSKLRISSDYNWYRLYNIEIWKETMISEKIYRKLKKKWIKNRNS